MKRGNSRRTADVRTCRRKRKYTEAKARETARYLNSRGGYLHAYKCPNCDGWHIGRLSAYARVMLAFERIDEERQRGTNATATASQG